MVDTKGATMSKRRALLTDREREIISGEADVEDSYRYQTISRVRSRFDRLEDDLEVFGTHGDLLDELREIVCEDSESEDIAESDSWSPPEATDEEQHPVVEEPEDKRDPVKDAVADIDFPATKDRNECVEAVRAAYELLKERGTATKKDFVREVMDEHSLEYDVDAALEKLDSPERYRGAWWRRVIKPALKSLPDVESPTRGASDWTYTGENKD